MVEIRAFNFEVRAEHGEKHGDNITGVPIVFGDHYDNGFWEETSASW